MNRLTFNSTYGANTIGQLGGGCKLPENVPWPTDVDGKPMLHLLTLNIKNLPNNPLVNFPEKGVISIFIPYDHLDKGHVPLLRPTRLSKGAKVLAFTPAERFINMNDHALEPPLQINLETTNDDDDDENLESKIGGTPAWLQDQIEIEGAEYFLQINYSDLDKNFPDHKGIIWGGEGYMFLSNKLSEDNTAGYFVVQFT